MIRLSSFLTGVLLISPLSVLCSNFHTVLSPFSITPSVEVLRSPVTFTKNIGASSASAVAVAGPISTSSFPVVQRVESLTSGDGSNSEIRDLLRSLLTELRGSGKSSAQTLSAPVRLSDSYGAPPPSDSYGAPPRNTYTDSGSSSYPDSVDSRRQNRPEKIVFVQQRQPARVFSGPSASAVATVQSSSPVGLKEIVRTVYQPVYVPLQYAPQVQYAQPQVQYAQPQVQYAQYAQYADSVPVVSAVPTTVQTGASAVAISTIHSQPALAIQQQQYSVPVIQQQVQNYATLQTAGTAILDDGGSSGGYRK